jgi:alpha-amylase/alpha-mannosidase (GH57 family)
MERYICIHGHFYQPPRENAWLEYIETQDSAYPYHDWNERVTDECYAPNTASRILDGEGYITQIVNNYSRISFDIGPTLLAWLQDNAADTYRAVLDADRISQETFSGHGSALAQAYNHMIMPLANHQDKYTQVLWGIKDFEHRFRRRPEGMWLPETAVDIETLDIMAEQEIRFTILATHQAKRVRQAGTDAWSDVPSAGVDTTMAYELNLPTGRKIAIFFYNGPVSREVAFEDLLKSGDNFAHRLADSFYKKRAWPQLVHIATDGETYGHHHRFADMALTYAIHCIEANNLAKITNYGEYLEKCPPAYEVEIIENTSWSCPHGVKRWWDDCGCNTGRNSKWSQAWRTPLRNALDWLRDPLAAKYQELVAQFLKDPWVVRNDYIEVILDRSPENVQKFIEQHRTHELNEEEVIMVLKLLELQRHAMLMYTSCGWFFDELSGLETVQIIQYAGRAIQLAQELFGDDIEQQFLERLALARSNLRQHGDARQIYDKYVRPAMVDLTKVTAHFAVSSLFEEYGKQAEIFCYHVDIEDYQTANVGKAKLAAGRVKVTSVITRESATLSFGVLHFGEHNVNAGVREYQGDEGYQLMLKELNQSFSTADFPEVIRLLDKHFGMSTYSIKDLFLDEQRKVLDNILESAMSEIEAAYYQVYEHHYPPMRFLSELGYPVPKSFHSAAEFILNGGLRKAVSADTLDLERIRSLLEETRTWQVELDTEGLSYLLQNTLERMMARLVNTPENIGFLQELLAGTEILSALPFKVDLWKVRNLYHEMLESAYPEFRERAQQGDTTAEEWLDRFVSLGKQLSMRVG